MDNENLTDIFLCYDAQLTDRVRAFLEGEGMEVMVRDRSMKDFPTAAEAEQILAVPDANAEAARAFIKNAIDDEVIPDEGKVL